MDSLKTPEQLKKEFEELRKHYRREGFSKHNALFDGVVVREAIKESGGMAQLLAVKEFFGYDSTTESRWSWQRFAEPKYDASTRTFRVREGFAEDIMVALAYMAEAKARK